MKPILKRLSLLVVVAAGFGACTVHPTETPALSGPSSFAQSLRLAAFPDQITADGSQSQIVVTVNNAGGGPVSGLPIQLAIVVGGAEVEFGFLSSRTVYTDAAGKAGAIYTAPVAPAYLAGGPSTQVSIYAIPIGSNFDTSIAERVSLRVSPPPVPATDVDSPTASMTYFPAAPKVGEVVTFSAGGSAPKAGHTIVNYFWDFGDGQAHDEHGDDASHAYLAPGTYVAVLGVVDEMGRTSSTFKSVVVSK